MDPALAEDISGVFRRAYEAGVVAIVCVGYDLASSEAAVELAQREARCFAAVGIHPNYASAANESDLEIVEQLAMAPKVVAIGETGLDYFREFSDAGLQREWFRAHLELARRLSLPVVIHNRDADDDVLEIVGSWAAQSEANDQPLGVMHCFSSTVPVMERAIAANFMISFAGPLTYKNARALPDVARQVPSDRYVVETDSPYLSPHPHRGTRNESARVHLIAERLAELRGLSVEQAALETTRNAARLFPPIADLVGATA